MGTEKENCESRFMFMFFILLRILGNQPDRNEFSLLVNFDAIRLATVIAW